ncbi:CynX/NimT family MFS transporter [Streptomyces sp. PSKA54]|uniref:CynX/NimT family MFS transporter n=2 Tax=Streptomyces TaxID=1883 RepID=A0A7W2CVC9_9ACTN|nr:CynX/NimT family MFS transporter [Streptomyces himalayensis]MBA4859803.1 CynX/NimT family MFS transporter [Streptomyces himalayensis subsp. aureolus]
MMSGMASEESPTMASTPSAPPRMGTASASVDTADAPMDSAAAPADTADEPGRPATRAWTTRLVIMGLVLSALNLRPAITSLGALLEEVRDGLGMSGSIAGLLTSVPPLCFAVFGVMAPRLARRFGPGAVVCAGMAAIAAGLAVRPYAGSTAGFLAASALALMGIAVSNVLMPVIVKRWFPDRVGSMTGLYSMALALGTSLAAAVTVPMAGALGGRWQSGLVVWAVLAAAAVLPWLPLVRASGVGARNGPENRPTERPADTSVNRPADTSVNTSVNRPANGPQNAPGPGPEPDAPRITRSRTAWALAVFFGLQATAAYITMGWMAQIFRDAGVPAGTAGLLLAVTMAVGVPLAIVIPRVATRLSHQGPIAVALGVCGLVGYAGLYLAPAGGAWAWALLLGVSNCAFPLALTLVGMRSRTAAGVAKLSAFAQSTGYLISIPGPLLVGVLYQHSGGWGLPLALMTALMIPQIVMGVLAGRKRTVEDEWGWRGAA